MERQGARNTGNAKMCAVVTDGEIHIYEKVKRQGKTSSLKTVSAIVCTIVAVAFASATIFMFTKVMSNEKLLEKLSSTFNAPSMNLSDTNRSHLDCSSWDKDGVLITKTGEKLLCFQGWTVFQRRLDGRIADFHNKTWEEYANGFGDVDGELWLGLRKLHRITSQGGCKLGVDLWSWDNETAYAEYSRFSVASEADTFRLNVGGYSGTAGDSMALSKDSQNGLGFTTVDRDNDKYPTMNCAGPPQHVGGWWHNLCAYATPNAIYRRLKKRWSGIFWNTWKISVSLKSTMLKVRCN